MLDSLDIIMAIVKMVKLCYSLDIVAIGNLQGSQVGAVIMAAAGGGLKECQPQWTSSITVVWEGRI